MSTEFSLFEYADDAGNAMPRLSIFSQPGYHDGMQHDVKKHPQTLMVTALAGGSLVLLLAAFLGWIVQGPEIFLTMAENGLSWCF